MGMLGSKFVDLVHFVDFPELLQKLWIAVIQADDFAKFGAVALFVFHDFAPYFHFPKQQ